MSMARPYLGDPKRTIEVLQKYNFAFQKRFGQNFLIDTHVLEKIIASAEITKDDFVLEIGPGIGTMTQYLAEAAREVAAVEIDKTLIPILQDTLKEWNNVTVINNDILKVDIRQLALEKNQGRPIKVVANLPYYITSPVIMALLEQSLPIKAVTVMVQKEAAVRLCANLPSRDCGAVTVAVRYYSEPRQLFTVSRGSFMPAPNVDSAVIRLDVKKDKPLSGDAERRLFAVVKGAFSQRRKMLCNTISSSLSVSKEQVAKALKDADIKETARAEELSLDDFIQFSDCLYQTTEEGF